MTLKARVVEARGTLFTLNIRVHVHVTKVGLDFYSAGQTVLFLVRILRYTLDSHPSNFETKL
jgi:hypothetical protein